MRIFLENWSGHKSTALYLFCCVFSDSDYSIAFNLAKADETFQYAEDPIVSGPLSYLHEMEGYLNLVHPYPDFYQQLQPITDDLEYPGENGGGRSTQLILGNRNIYLNFLSFLNTQIWWQTITWAYGRCGRNIHV